MVCSSSIFTAETQRDRDRDREFSLYTKGQNKSKKTAHKSSWNIDGVWVEADAIAPSVEPTSNEQTHKSLWRVSFFPIPLNPISTLNDRSVPLWQCKEDYNTQREILDDPSGWRMNNKDVNETLWRNRNEIIERFAETSRRSELGALWRWGDPRPTEVLIACSEHSHAILSALLIWCNGMLW